MSRHARADDEDDASPASAPPLRLVDPEPLDDDVAPEVRAVLDAVAALHVAVLDWATTAAAAAGAGSPAGNSGARSAAAGGGGRHRR